MCFNMNWCGNNVCFDLSNSIMLHIFRFNRGPRKPSSSSGLQNLEFSLSTTKYLVAAVILKT